MNKEPPINDSLPGAGMNVSADVVGANLQRLVEAGKISPEDADQIVWFFGVCKSTRATFADQGRLIGYDASTVSRIYTGRYDGRYENVIAATRSYRQLHTERERMSNAQYVETQLSAEVSEACDLALARQMPAVISGPSQIGKTEALQEYRRRSDHIVR